MIFKNAIIIWRLNTLLFLFLTQSPLTKKQLGIFLLCLTKDALEEYLSFSGLWKNNKYRPKHELIDMVVTGKDKRKIYDREFDDLTYEETNYISENKMNMLMIKN